MAGRKKGAPKTGGRAKGTPNKTTALIKHMIIDALEKSGGVDYLVTVARDNPAAFCTLLGKVLPLNHTSDDGSMKQPSVIRIVAADCGDS